MIKWVKENWFKIVISLFILSAIFYLWLQMFHLKLNPRMFKKDCYCLNCQYEGGRIFGKLITPEKEREYNCWRESVFKPTK